MRQRDFVSAIARRLPHQTQRDVHEVLDVFSEIVQDELMRTGSVFLPGIGTLSIRKRMIDITNELRVETGTDDIVGARRVFKGSYRPAKTLTIRMVRRIGRRQ